VVAKALPSKRRLDEIRRGYVAIHTLAELLEPEGLRTGTEVQAEVKQWQEGLESRLGTTPRQRDWREHFRRVVHSYGERILTCYHHPRIPRTNNDLEQALRALVRQERRITGRKHVGAKLVRIQGLVGAGEVLVHEPAAAERIATLPRGQRTAFQPRRQRLAKPRGQGLAFRREPAKFLASLEQL
jgi:hypothetical protein